MNRENLPTWLRDGPAFVRLRVESNSPFVSSTSHQYAAEYAQPNPIFGAAVLEPNL